MASFLLKRIRINTELAVSVSLQNIRTGEILPESSIGYVIDFSQEGACVILTKIMLKSQHLFFSTLDSNQFDLLLCLEPQDILQDKHEITAQSIWMNSSKYKGKHVFKIGVKFLQKQQKLFTLLK